MIHFHWFLSAYSINIVLKNKSKFLSSGVILILLILLPLNAFAAKKVDKKFSYSSIDTGSVVSIKSKTQRILSKGSLAKFRNKKVEVAEGTKDTIGNISKVIFTKQSKLQKNLSKIKRSSKTLMGKPVYKSEVFEFPDSFVLVKSTSINIVNPQKLAKASPQFKKFLGKKSNKKQKKMTQEGRRGLNRFIAKVLSKKAKNDPLKIAYTRGGEQGLIDAIIEGKGLFEVTEEVVIPKKLPPRIKGIPQLRSVKDRGFNFDKYQPSKFRLMKKIQPSKSIINQTAALGLNIISQIPETPPASAKMTRVEKKGARTHLQGKFLTGYTLGADFYYQRTWRFDSGLFRVKMGAGYTIGLRFPIYTNTKIEPTRITISGRRDVSTAFKTTTKAKPVNGDCAFYKEVGLNEGEATCGKELALDFYFGYGYKFRALWTTVVDHPYSEVHTPPWSTDFIPPYNNNRGGLPVWIPPSITNTEFGIGPVQGWLKAGFLLSGTGKIDFGYETLVNHEVTNSRRIKFLNPNPRSVANSLPAFEHTSGTSPKRATYGFKLLEPVYEIRPTITPGINIFIRLGYGRFSRNLTTGGMWVNSLRVPLAPVAFPRHAGTSSEYGYDNALKVFNPK